MNRIKLNRTKYFFSTIILFFGLFHIGLPLYADFILSFILAFLLRSWVASIVTVSSLLLGIIIINLAFDGEIDYSAHAMLSTNSDSYEPNKNIQFIQPFGDLFAIGGKKDELVEIIQERDIEFVTDSEGHRNRRFYDAPSYILVGDSFIVGNGTTQPDILSEKLNTLLDEDIYSLSYPLNPAGYEAKFNKYNDVLSGGRNVLLFYFEGNDFMVNYPTTDGVNREILSLRSVKQLIYKLEDFKSIYLKKVYPKSFRFSKVVNRKSRLSYSIIESLVLGTDDAQYVPQVVVEEIGGQKVGFLKSYNDVSNVKNLDTYIWSEKKLLDRIKYVFFIPTKYRVYHDLDENLPLQILSDRYNKLGVRVINLTPILKNEAKEKLEINEFVYWRDDTHWNGTGISIVADYIVDLLLSSTHKLRTPIQN